MLMTQLTCRWAVRVKLATRCNRAAALREGRAAITIDPTTDRPTR